MSSLPNPVAPVSTARSVGVKQGRGIVKLVLSGDAIIIRGQPKGGPPPEKQINLSNVLAPKLARRSNPNYPDSVQTGDEAFAWESRENLRKKIIGREVFFVVDYAPNEERCYGTVYLGTSENGENMTEMQVKEGMVEVRRVNVRSENTEHSRLIALEDQAKSEGKGKWVEPKPDSAIRDVKWMLDNPRNFVDSFHAKPVPAVIEHVRDGCTMRASLPSSHHQITFMLSGIKCPMIRRDPDDPKKEVAEPFAAEAKFYVESRLLQRDVKIILEGVSNQNILLATVHHPNGNISEMLLKEGFARCVDWSITSYSQGPEKLRALEKQAKEKKVRIWKDWVSKHTEMNIADKEFTGKVIQVVNADAIAIKTSSGGVRTIHLSSVRPPRFDDVTFKKEKDPAPPQEGGKGKSRPLYDVPYMFEAREFMRKKLIGKKVNVNVDYIKPSSVATESLGAFPERTCATVTSGGVNIAEALVSKGLVKVVRHRQDDDQRSSHYDDLLAAEQRAIKTGKGVNSKKEPPIHRVAEISSDVTKAKQFLPFLQRAGRSEAVVEYVFGGSRLKLYIPRETCLITFLLAGIDCPRGARNGAGGLMKADPFADQALAFTKDQCMHREVMVEVETIDRVGNFIGWVFVDGKNISQLLLENGLSKLHFTAERSNYYKLLLEAEEKARAARIKIWEDFVEAKEVEEVVVEEVTERKTNFRNVCITEVTPQLHFYYQQADGGSKLDVLMEQLRSTLLSDPPLPGSYKPRRGDFCVAIFSADGLWYRARIEKISGDNIHVHFIDFGNKEIVTASRVSSLPADFNTHVLLPQAHECALALVNPPSDEDSLVDAFQALCRNLESPSFLLNTEYKDNGLDYVSLLNSNDKTDIGKLLVTTGYCTVSKRREKRLAGMVSDYVKDQENAKKQHLNLWRYGDITDDDATEFGYKKN